MTIDEAIEYCLEVAEHNEALIKRGYAGGCNSHDCSERAENHRQLAEWLKDLKEAKRLLQASEKTIDDYCRGYCECCKNRDFELARCGLVNGCRDKDNWEWILSYRVKELFKEAENG